MSGFRTQVGRVEFPVPHAAGREREEKHARDYSGLSLWPSSWMEGLPVPSQEIRNAVPFSSTLLLRPRYPSGITRLKGGLL